MYCTQWRKIRLNGFVLILPTQEGAGISQPLEDNFPLPKQYETYHWCGIAGRVAVERDGLPLGDDQVGRVLQDDRGRVRLRIPGMMGQQVRVAKVI